MTMGQAAEQAIVEVTFREQALAEFEKAGGDAEMAATRLTQLWMADKTFMATYLEVLVRHHAKHTLSMFNKDRRHRDLRSLANVVPINGSTFNAAVQANHDRLMARPVWGGKAIAQCTASEIRESADRFTKQGSVMLREATWQFAVAESVEKARKNSDATVAEVLDESALSILWEATKDA